MGRHEELRAHPKALLGVGTSIHRLEAIGTEPSGRKIPSQKKKQFPKEARLNVTSQTPALRSLSCHLPSKGFF